MRSPTTMTIRSARSAWSSPAHPVEPDGSPVYYRVPESLDRARNDGQLWRWALAQAAEAHPSMLNVTRITLAEFLHDQFGTQTIIGHDVPVPAEERAPDSSGAYALDTLKDDETIAWLATGIKRFKLPDEFNPIKIFQAIDADPSGQKDVALQMLATIFENRLQFDRSVGYLKRSIESFGDEGDGKKRHIDQILGAWGQFEALETRPAGTGATVDFRFRNGKQVHFEAHEILYTKLLDDVKEYITSRPGQLDWQKLDISDIGTRLVVLDQKQYVGRSVARWDLDLVPRPAHFDRRITVTTPLQKAAPTCSTAQMEGGNQSRVVVWLDDTVIVKKRLHAKTYYFVADSRTGQPIAGAGVDFFGWRACNRRARTSTASRPGRSRGKPTGKAGSRYRRPSWTARTGTSSG